MKNYSITKLDNGITVVSENIHYVKSFSLGFWFNAGSREETANNNGISHFVEHMLFKGTETRSARKIADTVESLGGYLNAFTTKEHTCYYGRGLSDNIEKTFEVLADMIQNSVFRNSEIRKEASVILDELYDIEDTPEELIFDEFESALFRSNSLGLPIIGTKENISKFNRQSILDYVESNYTFDKLFIVASGNINHQDLIRFTEKYFKKDLGRSGKKRDAVRIKAKKDIQIYREIQQAHLILGRSAPGIRDDRRIPINLLSHILGEGSSSRLFQSIREKNGIAYQVNSFLSSFFDVSAFGVYLSTNEKSIEKALNIISNEFAKLRNKKVSEKELKKAKEYLKGNLLMSLESTTNRMLRIAQSVIYFGQIEPVENTISKIDAVSRDQIIHLSNLYLNPDSFSKTIVSSKNLLMHSAA